MYKCTRKDFRGNYQKRQICEIIILANELTHNYSVYGNFWGIIEQSKFDQLILLVN